ncbi:MAG: VTT domain-containing protein [Candidatus Moranbacteria bacterium]|nr:VTT domain-containing protein [Candidatus Moranbacteria bacterium]MDD3964767.1 VTT domain-containing protein [Candidatus Moranbacteria bacterium]
MHFFHAIEQFITHFSTTVPLPVFVFVGSFLEEVISPIPSALVMGTAGTLAMIEGNPFSYLFLLAAIGNIGKASGAWIYYFIGDKLENILVKPLTKYFGINHHDIENIGKRFTGHHWKDGGVLFLIRLFPPFPTTPVSLACGIIKMDTRVFLAATYAGNFFKDLLYLYIGYAGFASLHFLWHQTNKMKLGVDIIVTLAIIAFFVFLFFHQRRGKKFLRHCQSHSVDFLNFLKRKK